MSSPRISRIRLSETVNRFSPPNRISPPTISPGGPTSRINESAVIDLPHPDSPTSPRRSPSSSGKRTPSTARTSPARVRKCVRRFLTSSRCDILCREYARKSRETSRERRGGRCRGGALATGRGGGERPRRCGGGGGARRRGAPPAARGPPEKGRKRGGPPPPASIVH